MITKDGTSVSALSELREQISFYKAGEQVEITYNTQENGAYVEKTATVTLGEKQTTETKTEMRR